jgi:hypothetical protein
MEGQVEELGGAESFACFSAQVDTPTVCESWLWLGVVGVGGGSKSSRTDFASGSPVRGWTAGADGGAGDGAGDGAGETCRGGVSTTKPSSSSSKRMISRSFIFILGSLT